LDNGCKNLFNNSQIVFSIWLKPVQNQAEKAYFCDRQPWGDVQN